jgi:hypothetical protein
MPCRAAHEEDLDNVPVDEHAHIESPTTQHFHRRNST